MSSSYIDRGGTVGGQNPKDKELQRQFWADQNTAHGHQKHRELGPNLGRLLMLNADQEKLGWGDYNYNHNKLELNEAA